MSNLAPHSPSPSRPSQAQPPSSVPSPPDHYTIITRGISFSLSHSQISFDSPNYFTAAFLSHDFAESTSRTIHLDRNPQLFALIVEHLSGYRITPLNPDGIPSCMSVEQATENLLADAMYFGLDQLQARLLEGQPKHLDKPYRDQMHGFLRFSGLRGSQVERAAEAIIAEDIWDPQTVRAIAHGRGSPEIKEMFGLTLGAARAVWTGSQNNNWKKWETEGRLQFL